MHHKKAANSVSCVRTDALFALVHFLTNKAVSINSHMCITSVWHHRRSFITYGTLSFLNILAFKLTKYIPTYSVNVGDISWTSTLTYDDRVQTI